MSSVPYIQGHSATVHQSHQSRKASNTCTYFTDHLKPNSHVLDAGCGPGTITSSLAEFIPQGSIVGIDNAASVVDKARGAHLPDNCSFEVADMTSLPYADCTFDVIHTSQALVHIPDVMSVMREFYRVCKPGGFIACREGDIPAAMLYPDHPGLQLWRRAMIDTMANSHCHPTGGRQLIRWAIDSGFNAEKITYTVGTMTYYGKDREFWGSTMGARVKDDVVWRKRAIECASITTQDFDTMQTGWHAFTQDSSAVFAMPCGELVAYK